MNKIITSIAMVALLALNTARADYPRLPDFKLPTATGEIEASMLKGKVVYVDFWASWCKPCKKSFPWLNKLQSKYKAQGLEVIAINLDKDRIKADEFLKKIPANFKVAFDPEGDTAISFKVQGMPSSYLVDRNGFMRAKRIGFREKDEQNIENAVNKFLAE